MPVHWLRALGGSEAVGSQASLRFFGQGAATYCARSAVNEQYRAAGRPLGSQGVSAKDHELSNSLLNQSTNQSIINIIIPPSFLLLWHQSFD